MSVTEVGTPAAPAVSSGTNAPSVSPSWDASQTRTAGNYLVCAVTNWGGTTGGTPGTPSGWTQLLTITSNARSVVTYFGKVAAGSDSAPTVSATNTGTATFSTLTARLVELTGVDTTIPVAVTATVVGTTVNPLVATSLAKVPQSGCFALGAAVLTIVATAASTLGAGSGWTNVADNGSSSGTRSHWIHTEQSGPTSGSVLAESFSYTGTGSFLAGAFIVFQPTGSMTVTATPDAAATGAAAKVYVVTSAAESGGTAGHTAGGPGTKSITPAQTNSLVLWANQDFFGNNAFTAAANNTIDEQFGASVGARYAHGHYSGTVTSGSAITVGATSADGSTSALTAIYELIPSGGTPAIDGSTQPGQSENAHAGIVSYPFVPPNGAVLVVVCESTSFPANFTISDTHGLTWTRRDGGTDGSASIYTATFSANATATPSVVSCAASIGTALVNKLAPGVVQAVASIGSATVNTGEIVTPGVVACTASVGSPTVGAPTITAAAFGTGTVNTATTLAAPAPAGVGLGDLLLIWVIDATSTVTFSITAGSTGWTAVGPSTGQNITGTLFYKNADSTDVSLSGSAGSYTVTASAGHSAEGIIIRAPGFSFDPTPTTAGQYAASAAGSSFAATGVTTSDNGDLLLLLGGVRAASGTPSALTLAAGFTTVVAQANTTSAASANVGVILGTATQTTAGATGSETITSAGATNGGAFLMALSNGSPTPGSVVQMVAGAPTASGFGVITKLSGATSVRLAYSTSPSMTSPSFVSAQTPDGNGYVTHAVSGLSAATRYYVQAADTPTGGAESLIGSIGSCKTLAASGSPASFTVALVACIAEQDVTSPAQGVAIADAVAWGPDLTIHTGDFDYSGTTSTSTDTQRGVYETQIAAIPSLPAMVSQMWGYYCRSDHEAGPDNGDSDNAYTAANIAAALQVFPFGTLGDTVNTPVHGLYQSWVVGRVRFIMIDIRNTDRSPGANTDDGTKTMLGATQLAWLESELVQSEPLKVIISDVAWMGNPTTTNGPDKWWSYSTERQAIIDYIAAHQAAVQNVTLWHGDSHTVAYATAAKNTWGGFPVYCAAPLLNVGGGLMLSTFSAQYNNTDGECRQYGRITITDTGSQIAVNFQGWDAVNSVAQVSTTDVFDTTQPSVINCVATIGTATVLVGQTAHPSVIPAPATFGSTVVKTGETVTPSVVAAVASVPAPTPNTGSTAKPAVVACAATIGATFLGLFYSAQIGTSGSALTTSDVGSGQTPFDTVSAPAGGTLAYDNTHPAPDGTLAVKAATGATTGTSTGTWSPLGKFGGLSFAKLWYSIDLYVPASLSPAARFLVMRNGTVHAGSLLVTGTTIGLSWGSAFNGGVNFTTPIPTGQFVRLAGYVIGDVTVGEVQANLYTDPDSNIPVETQTASAKNTTGVLNRVDVGQGNSSASSGPFWWAWVQVSPFGPINPPTKMNTLAAPARVSAVATIGASSPLSNPTPSVVACTATIGTAAPNTGETAHPAVVASVASIGTAIVQASSTAKPAVIPATATIGTAVVGASGTATPSVVPAPATFGTTTPNTGSKVTPPVVAGIATVGNPAPNTGEVANPVVISVVASVFTPTVSTITKATPAVVSVTATIGTASPHGGAQASPARVSATATISIPTMHTGTLVQAVMVACAAVLASPTVIAAQPYTPGPWILGAVTIRWGAGQANMRGYSAGDVARRWSLGSARHG